MAGGRDHGAEVPSFEMPLPEELLEVLACPNCHGKIELTDDLQAVECAEDRLRFPIVDGIPVMLLDEATPY